MNHSEIISFLWGVADLVRDTFKRGKYQDIILPLTVLRRLDCVLADTKEKVLAKQAELRGKKLVLSAGESHAQILEDYPYLDADDIAASLLYAARRLNHPDVAA